jgi:cysteine-rich repeat protein
MTRKTGDRMSLRVGRCFERATLLLLVLWCALPQVAAAQACPSGKFCFYVPPALPVEASHSLAASRVFDIVLSAPVSDVTGTYSIANGAALPFTVSPGTSLRIPLTALNGPATAYGTAERKGVYLVADSQDLTVDHRETFDSEEYSETIKRHTIALGSRFRLGGYSLNREGRPNAGVDSVLIYAPTGGDITLTAPPGATLPFWLGSATAEWTISLTEGQTVAARTVVGKDFDGALLTSTQPVSVSSGGRGWSSSSCGDDGMDGLVPVSALGTEYVVRLPTGSYVAPNANTESRVSVIADVDATEVRVNGVVATTLNAGEHYNFAPFALSYVQTSKPALVWMNGSLNGCELDTVLIPPIAFRPALTELSLDFNVLASNQTPAGEMAILIATADVGTIRLGGAQPALTSNEAVPGRAELSYVRFNVTSGDKNVRAASDFQALLATRTQPSGLLAYYNPYRIPGCGDGGIDPGETCDDGDTISGDGCDASCQREPGFTCSGDPSVCVTTCGDTQVGAPAETCDDGNATAGDGCSAACRVEVRITTPTEASVTADTTPTVSGTAERNAVVTLQIGAFTTTVTADASGAWTFTPSAALPEGANSVTASATDGAGGTSSVTRSFSIDSATALTITAPVEGAVVADTTPTIRGTGEPGATVQVSIEGALVGPAIVAADGSWTLMVGTPLTAGSKVVSATATDATNNMAVATPVTFVVDLDTTLAITGPGAGSVVTNAMPTLSGTAEPGSTVMLSVTDAQGKITTATITTQADSTWSVALTTPLASGNVTVIADATDAAGNKAQATSTFTVDAGTYVMIETPSAGALVPTATPTVSGLGEPGASVEVRLDGSVLGNVVVDAGGRWTLVVPTPLNTGTHTIVARATDTTGNQADASVEFNVNAQTAPLLEIRNPPDMSRTNDPRPPLTGFADPGAHVSVLIDGFFLDTVTASARGSWAVQLIAPLTVGAHVLVATTTNAAGVTVTDRHEFAVDPAVPTLTITAPVPGSVLRDATPTIAGTSTPGARVQVSIDGTVIGEVTAGGDGSWTIDAPSALTDGRHATCAVADAGQAPGQQASFELGFFVDTKTFVSILVPSEGGVVGSATPVIAGVGEPGAMLTVSIDGVPVADVDVQADGTWSTVAPTALAAGAHRVSVQAVDAIGNQASDENAFTYDPTQADSDGDGRPDRDECNSSPCPDSDGDGMTDERDADDDGDGLPTANECSSAPCRDSDGDGKPNYLDPDDDNDGRPTAEERNGDGSTRDTDQDSIPDHLDPDDDGDGLTTQVECAAAPCPDTDGDGTPDFLDPDDDNDRIPTARERDDGMRYGNDLDGDGVVAWLDPDANDNGAKDGVDGIGDRDGDNIPDYIELDTPAPDGLITDEGFAIAGGGGCSAAPRGSRDSTDALGMLCIALAAIAVRRRRPRLGA